jgi:hypothetical protein
MTLLWLYVPDFDKNGSMAAIHAVPNTNGTGNYWEEDPNCSGFSVSDNPDCRLRVTEMSLLSYTPDVCSNLGLGNCKDVVAFARFNVQQAAQQEAQLQFFTTIFTCFVLTIASLTFSNDTEVIVIVPITKMVGIIKTLADDPL